MQRVRILSRYTAPKLLSAGPTRSRYSRGASWASVLVLGLAGICGLGSLPLQAAPVPETERIPVDLRRTTLVVRDIDKSLPLYRDTLGFKVIYDEKIGPGPGSDGKPQPPSVRLVLLRANDDFVGVLGLMQRLKVDTPPPPPVFQKAQPGGLILVINVADLDQRFARVRDTPYVKIAEEPSRMEYPAPGGQGTIPVLFSAIWDADGNFIELNKILGTPAGRSRKP